MPDISAPTSLYQAPSVQFNPLEQLTKIQALKNSQQANVNSVLQNKMLQQGYDATQAQQQAYQSAIQPDGTVDNNALVRSMGSGAGAQNTGAVQASVASLKQAGQSLTQAQFDLGQKHLDTVSKIAGAIAADPNASQGDVFKQIGMAVQNGMISPQIALQGLSDLPPPGSPPGAIQKWAATHLAQATGQKEQLNQMGAQYINTGNGAQTQQTNINPNNVLNPEQITTTQQLSPESATAPVTVLKPDGTPGITPRGQLWGGQGGGSTQGGAPAQPGGLGSGRYPKPPGAPQAGQVPFVQTGLPPGAGEMATAGAARVGELQTAASGAGQLKSTYDKALALVDSAMVGKGSDGVNAINTVLNTFGLKAGANTAESTQTLHKYLANAAMQAGQQLPGGLGSDARLDALASGQPSTSMNAPALKDAIKYVKGLQQGVLDKQQAVQNYLAHNDNNTANFGQFEAQYNKAFNSDVSYVRSISDPKQKEAAIRALPDHAAYVKSVQAMKQMGAF